ncbi:MAG: nuclear transport factor 2 family protein [Sphingomonadaceae bacterium]|nr:nuclear transport factor 2 family protein [Sphingomonadaceae bacterium]
MPTVREIARDFTALLRAGQFEAAGERYWAPDVTSIEPAGSARGMCAAVTGVAEVRRKCHARFAATRIDELGIDGPFVTGNQFALFLDLMIADPLGSTRYPFSEIALYTVRDGRIAEERYFHD